MIRVCPFGKFTGMSASLTEGARQLHAILAHSMGIDIPAALAPVERMDPEILGATR